MAARRGPIDADADAADAIVAVIAERFVPDAGERLNVEALRQRKVVDVASEGHGDVLRHFLFHRPRAAGTNRVVHRVGGEIRAVGPAGGAIGDAHSSTNARPGEPRTRFRRSLGRPETPSSSTRPVVPTTNRTIRLLSVIRPFFSG